MLRIKYSQDLLNDLMRYFNPAFIRRMLHSLAVPPSRYYLRVNTLRISREELIARLRRYGLKVFPDEVLKDAVYIRVNNVPQEVPVSKYTIVADKHAAESVMMGANLYIPGIVKFDKDISPGDYVTIIDPKGNVVAWGRAVVGSDEIRSKQKGIAVKVMISRYRVVSLRDLDEYKKGLFYAQSYPAILTSHLLDPSSDDIVVDMCASPGGKATHLAQLMGNKGIIYAFDKSQGKIERLKENVIRLGIKCIKPIVHDSRYLHIDYPWLKADKVLLDPPCSALGVRPKLYEEKTLSDVLALAEYQKQFLKAAYAILKRDGILVYSTCTMTPHENEYVVKYAVRNLGFKLLSQNIFVGSYGIPINGIDHELLQRFFPHLHDTPGYFIALLRKS
ncbi:MAG: 16S rRNA methyltransferase [Thermoprotei archaeon]|nr:MAG: 16S rRNA methyltransferase [Thermoprotei archaeon]RLF19438.1 MAG: 16S rRNA methyltransferase [Thermoprotei archaeon]